MTTKPKKREGPPPPAKPRSAGRPCRVCLHPKLAEINTAVIKPASPLKQIAIEFDLSVQSLQRHRANHIPTEAMQASAAAVIADEAEHGADLVSTVTRLLREAEGILAECRTDKDRRSALGAIREGVRAAEALGKLSGLIDTGITLNLAVAPALSGLQTTILAALANYPDARMAVIAALQGQREPLMLEHQAIDV